MSLSLDLRRLLLEGQRRSARDEQVVKQMIVKTSYEYNSDPAAIQDDPIVIVRGLEVRNIISLCGYSIIW